MTMTEITESEKKRALDLAVEAGQILLENGAEIKRVGETMDRIASSFGVEEKSFIVLGNGIIASGKDHADVRNVPIKGPRTEMVVAVNQLSRRDVMTRVLPVPAPARTRYRPRKSRRSSAAART